MAVSHRARPRPHRRGPRTGPYDPPGRLRRRRRRAADLGAVGRLVDAGPVRGHRRSTSPTSTGACSPAPIPSGSARSAIVITLAVLAGGVAISGGPRSPALPWMVLPGAMVAARFRLQVVVAGAVLTVDPDPASSPSVSTPPATIDDPVPGDRRPGAPRRRHLDRPRPAGRRAAPPRRGDPRPAHRPAQPPRPGARASSRSPTRRASPTSRCASCCATSTTSRPSTTSTATTAATPSCATSPTSCASGCAPSSSSTASAARSS